MMVSLLSVFAALIGAEIAEATPAAAALAPMAAEASFEESADTLSEVVESPSAVGAMFA